MGRGVMRHAGVDVPAKVNLFLRIDGLRDDGYHDLVTIMQTVGMHDRVSVDASGLPDGRCPDQVSVTFDHDGTTGVPDDDDNLVLRAARELLAELDVEEVRSGPVGDESARSASTTGNGSNGSAVLPTLAFDLDKQIPVAAGMAGGSADAAGALIALSALLDCGFELRRLRTLAARIGADVPFCVTGGTAMATGTGTIMCDMLSKGTFHWVVGISDDPLSTPEVYREWDRIGRSQGVDEADVVQAVRSGDAGLLGHAMHNDLQAAAFSLRPSLADDVDALLVAGALGSIVTGSGPTVIGLASDPEHAHELARACGERFDRVAVASSPAGGPQLRVG